MEWSPLNESLDLWSAESPTLTSKPLVYCRNLSGPCHTTGREGEVEGRGQVKVKDSPSVASKPEINVEVCHKSSHETPDVGFHFAIQQCDKEKLVVIRAHSIVNHS